VLTGKILEQSTLELEQEEEMKNIRQARTNFLARLHKEKMERKEIEEKEIKRKNDFDNVKKIKKLDKFSKISTQQKLISRVFSKVYLQGFTKKTIGSMSSMFKKFGDIKIKDKYNGVLYNEVEKLQTNDEVLSNAISYFNNMYIDSAINTHSSIVNEKKQKAIQKKLDEETRRQEAVENERIAKLEQIERRKKRTVLRLQRDIQKEIFDNQINQESENVDSVTEINNFDDEGPYGIIFITLVGVYGGILTILMITLDFIKKNLYNQDNLFTQEHINDFINAYLAESGPITLYFNIGLEQEIAEVLVERETIDINALKGMDLTSDEWVSHYFYPLALY
jgi:hypothetical protein